MPTVVLLRATVAAMKCRDYLKQSHLGEAIAELGVLHDALVELGDTEIGEAGAMERAKLIQHEQELTAALRQPWRAPP